jgi:hypothetical protein
MNDYETLLDKQRQFIESALMPRMVVGDQPTVRDQFAMAALPALLSSRDCWTAEQAADLAYKIADAMMEARK